TGDAAGIGSLLSPAPAPAFNTHTFPATGQTTCWENSTPVACDDTGLDGDVQAGAALEYRDNLDGTITDMNTGLMWEKKSFDFGPHEWDNCYPWSGVCTGDVVIECQRDGDCAVPGGTCRANPCLG